MSNDRIHFASIHAIAPAERRRRERERQAAELAAAQSDAIAKANAEWDASMERLRAALAESE